MAVSEEWDALYAHWELVKQEVDDEVEREYIRLAGKNTTDSLETVRYIQGRIDALMWTKGLAQRNMSRKEKG